MKWFIIFVVVFIFGVVSGSVATSISKAMNPPYFTIRIIDNQKCSDREYSIETKENIITIKPDAIDNENHPVARYAEAFFHIIPNPDLTEKYGYKVHARYSDCADIVSDERIVERGWVLYESIRDGKVDHHVRAK